MLLPIGRLCPLALNLPARNPPTSRLVARPMGDPHQRRCRHLLTVGLLLVVLAPGLPCDGRRLQLGVGGVCDDAAWRDDLLCVPRPEAVLWPLSPRWRAGVSRLWGTKLVYVGRESARLGTSVMARPYSFACAQRRNISDRRNRSVVTGHILATYWRRSGTPIK